mgnify:CR=1 FL=1
MGIRQSAAEYGSALSDQQITVAGTAVGLTRPTGAIAGMVTNDQGSLGYPHDQCRPLP